MFFPIFSSLLVSFVGLVFPIAFLTAGCIERGLPRGLSASSVPGSGSEVLGEGLPLFLVVSCGLLLLLLGFTGTPLPRPLDDAGVNLDFGCGGLGSSSSAFLFVVPFGLKSLSSGILLDSVFQLLL